MTTDATLRGNAYKAEGRLLTEGQDRPEAYLGMTPLLAKLTEPKAVMHAARTGLRARSILFDRTAPDVLRWRPYGLITMLPLAIGDGIAFITVTVVAMMLSRAMRGLPVTEGMTLWASLSLLPLQVAYFFNGLYPGVGTHPVLELRQLARLHLVAFAGAAVWTLVEHEHGRLLSFALASVMATATIPLARALVRHFFGRCEWWGFPTLVLGSGESLRRAIGEMRRSPHAGLRPVAAVDLEHPSSVVGLGGLARFSSPIAAVGWARRSSVPYALIAMPGGTAKRVGSLVRRCSRHIPHVQIASGPIEMPTLWRDARHCGGLSGTEVINKLSQPFPRIVKRGTDLALTTLIGILILPLFLAIVVAIKISDPGPVFFGHKRIGVNGRKFKAWKFRSMVVNGDAILRQTLASDPAAQQEWDRDHKLKNDPRVTWIGSILRTTSLDELPQLWNVFCGEMSLVGPRPIVDEEVRKYGRVYRKYKSVRPGVTGLWQVSGRNNTTYEQRVNFDEWYVKNWSPWLDLWVLARTIDVLVCRRGAY